jgi:phytoene dehydrogenase-like protein
MIFLSTLNVGDAGWPIGGSAALSRNIEKRYCDVGGEVHYKSKVKKIIVENDIAKGVQLEDGTQHYADLIVSAADGYSTIVGMLEDKYTTEFIRSYYRSYPKSQPFGLEIWYGVNRSFSGEPHALVLFLDQPLNVEGKERDRLDIEILNFDDTLAPPGKTVIKVTFDSEYTYWKQLSADQANYRAQKQQIANAVADKLEKRFPGFKENIEASDVATPVTVEHWTGGYRGFSEPWPAPAELAKEINKNGVSKTLPGLNNFYMVGQWAGGTFGISTVCLMGRSFVQEQCKKDQKTFKPQ